MKLDSSLRDHGRKHNLGRVFAMPEGRMQGRSVFGGLTVAAAAALASKETDGPRPLRSCSLKLRRPVASGPVRGAVAVLHQGKSTAFVEER